MDYSVINFNELAVKHWIKFKYDTNDSIDFQSPHHIFKIEDSIHFKSLEEDEFEDYVKLITTTKQKEHSLELFLKLKDEFNIESINRNKIKLYWNEKLKKYIVEDGCHRLSIIKLKGLDDNGDMPIEWFEIRKN